MNDEILCDSTRQTLLVFVYSYPLIVVYKSSTILIIYIKKINIYIDIKKELI